MAAPGENSGKDVEKDPIRSPHTLDDTSPTVERESTVCPTGPTSPPDLPNSEPAQAARLFRQDAGDEDQGKPRRPRKPDFEAFVSQFEVIVSAAPSKVSIAALRP